VPSGVVIDDHTDATQSLLESLTSDHAEVACGGPVPRLRGRSEREIGAGARATFEGLLRFGRGQTVCEGVNLRHQLSQPAQRRVDPTECASLEDDVLIRREVDVRCVEWPARRLVMQFQDDAGAMHRRHDSRLRLAVSPSPWRHSF